MKNHIADTRRQLTELNRLENEALIESLRASMPLSVLMLHDVLRARGRQSIAEVRHGVCSGCHMGLSTGLQAEVQRQTTIPKCETCGRFLFSAVGTPVPAPPPESPRKKPVSRRPTKS